MGTLRFFEEVVSFKIRRTFGFADYICIRSKDIHSFSDSENNRRAASVNFWQSADKPFPASDIFRTFGSDKPILLWR